LKALFDRFRTRGSGSLTAQARRLSVDDLSSHQQDFFTVAKRPAPNGRIIAALAVTMVAGSAAMGVVIATSGSGKDTASVPETTGSLAAGTNPASDSGNDAYQLKTASVETVTSSKGNFNGEIAKAVAANPMQTMSVAYINGGATSPAGTQTSSQMGYPAPASDALAYSEPTVVEGTIELASLGDPDSSTSVQKTLPPEPVDEQVVLRQGETLIQRLVELGVTTASARAVAAAIEPVYPGRLVRVGQTYTVTLDREQDFYGKEVIAPVRVSFTPPGGEEIIVESDDDGRYIAMIDGKQAKPRNRLASAPHLRTKAKITSSVYATAKDNGVPSHIINAAMKVLGYEIDLQRQIRAGDTLELFYGNPLTGSSTKRKVLHYAKLHAAGRKHIYYRFTDSKGNTAYFDENGEGATKSLMRTPISGVRITSGFGMRRHPLLGYNKLHTGIDFGAPRGTPIKAAGDGVVVHAGWRGAYGRTVVIKHNDKYSTLYAHMSKTARLKKGSRVRQGQVIGYVGSTGRSTGPHLHYEVRRNGRPINPKRVQMATKVRLKGDDLARFKRHKNKIMAMMKDAPASIQIAQASGSAN
jgi:murein DD-endopeptidase MepM/ murein hydrolase activator NlpD